MTLGELLEAIDTQVRAASLKAHADTVKGLAVLEPAVFGKTEIPGTALMPREVLEASTVKMEFELWMHDDGVSLSKKFFGSGARTKVSVEWRTTQTPEALSLVRTKSETQVK